MPIYEYSCLSCNKKFDMIRQIKDADTPVSCIACQSTDTKRELTTCFSRTAGGYSSPTSTGGGCSGCSGGSCGSCRH